MLAKGLISHVLIISSHEYSLSSDIHLQLNLNTPNCLKLSLKKLHFFL